MRQGVSIDHPFPLFPFLFVVHLVFLRAPPSDEHQSLFPPFFCFFQTVILCGTLPPPHACGGVPFLMSVSGPSFNRLLLLFFYLRASRPLGVSAPAALVEGLFFFLSLDVAGRPHVAPFSSVAAISASAELDGSPDTPRPYPFSPVSRRPAPHQTTTLSCRPLYFFMSPFFSCPVPTTWFSRVVIPSHGPPLSFSCILLGSPANLPAFANFPQAHAPPGSFLLPLYSGREGSRSERSPLPWQYP